MRSVAVCTIRGIRLFVKIGFTVATGKINFRFGSSTWTDVATCNLATTDFFHWISLGNQTISGIRFYGNTTLGNNPGYDTGTSGTSHAGNILNRIEVYPQ